MLRERTGILAVLALAACGSDKETLPVADEDADADADTDADADADADTDADTDADEPALLTRPDNPTCLAPDRPPSGTAADVERAFPSLSFTTAVQIVQPPDDPDTYWVVEQEGRILAFDDDPAASTTRTVVDLTGRVFDAGNEQGLLSISFHPDWATNHQIVASYTGAGGASVVSRFASTDGGATIDPSTEEILLTFGQPYSNHNGGSSAFGPDGLLYLGFGDGGLFGDPLENGQDRFSLLGKILRIDIDGGAPYTIPPDNPFADGVDGAPEVYAYGLRNPWRFSFDPVDGTFWVADVGQDRVEEIDRVELGGNYGWDTMEGNDCYEPRIGCDQTGLLLPVETMLHSDGHFSVTGGVVYRGSAIPSLVGKYVWADYGSGQVWYLDADPLTGEEHKVELVSGLASVTHIGTDRDGEILFLLRNAGIRRLVPVGTEPASDFPQTLPETGCFDADNQPLPMLVPYEVAVPFWSDGAEKHRWLSVPDGERIAVDAEGRLELPVGSVLVKEFEHGGQKVETRLLVRHDDGEWAGYSYAWNADRTEARLLPGAGRVDDWTIPSRAECRQCHNAGAGGSLGLGLDQVDFEARQPNGYVENQVDQLVRLDLLEAPATRPGPLPALDGGAPLEDRARAWLDSNCSQCHYPAGPANGDLDLRFETALADTGLCGVATQGTLGIGRDARVIAPGDPDASVLVHRISELGAYHMPPIATHVVDPEGTALVSDWVAGLATCP